MNISDCCHEELPLEEDIEGRKTPAEVCPKCGNFCQAKYVSCFGDYQADKEYCRKVCRYALECARKKSPS